jgi:hypothetical protein
VVVGAGCASVVPRPLRDQRWYEAAAAGVEADAPSDSDTAQRAAVEAAAIAAVVDQLFGLPPPTLHRAPARGVRVVLLDAAEADQLLARPWRNAAPATLSRSILGEWVVLARASDSPLRSAALARAVAAAIAAAHAPAAPPWLLSGVACRAASLAFDGAQISLAPMRLSLGKSSEDAFAGAAAGHLAPDPAFDEWSCALVAHLEGERLGRVVSALTSGARDADALATAAGSPSFVSLLAELRGVASAGRSLVLQLPGAVAREVKEPGAARLRARAFAIAALQAARDAEADRAAAREIGRRADVELQRVLAADADDPLALGLRAALDGNRVDHARAVAAAVHHPRDPAALAVLADSSDADARQWLDRAARDARARTAASLAPEPDCSASALEAPPGSAALVLVHAVVRPDGFVASGEAVYGPGPLRDTVASFVRRCRFEPRDHPTDVVLPFAFDGRAGGGNQ